MTHLLIVKNRNILLVPKGVASYSAEYTSSRYYQHFVLNFMQNEHLQMNSALIQETNDGKKFVTKKDLSERHPFSKEFIATYTLKHPEILKDFKARTTTSSLTNQELTGENFQELIDVLIDRLESIQPGNADASAFHKLVTGILEIIFYPSLIYPRLEAEIHQGRKRIDIVFDNAAEIGIFYRLHKVMQLSSQYIFVECKNYSVDPSNPELDQLAGRFSPNRGRVGFMVCRKFENYKLFLQKMQGHL